MTLRYAQLCFPDEPERLSQGAQNAYVLCSKAVFLEMTSRISKNPDIVEPAANDVKVAPQHPLTLASIWDVHLRLLARCGCLADTKELLDSTDLPIESREQGWVEYVKASGRDAKVEALLSSR